MNPVENFTEQVRRAIGAHGQWKLRLDQAIASGASDVSVAVVRRDDQCEFGRWLHGPLDPVARACDAYRDVVALHAEFHREAAAALELALAGRTEEAQAAIARGSAFARTSAALTGAMMGWLTSSSAAA
jgi:chemoreceptor zinc-binding protein